MQDGITALPHWMQLALTALASILSTIGIDRLYSNWLNRKKPAAEIQLTTATATEVTVRAGSSAGDAVMRMMDRLDKAQLDIDRLRTERDNWRVKAMNAEDDSKTAQMFVDQLNMAARLKGVKLSDFTPQQLRPPTDN